jgi:tripeptide aminopeptidase
MKPLVLILIFVAATIKVASAQNHPLLLDSMHHWWCNEYHDIQNMSTSEQDSGVPSGYQAVAPWPTVSPGVSDTIAKLLKSKLVTEALRAIKDDDPRTLNELILLTEIPAPTFEEQNRAEAFLALLKQSGIKDSYIDSAGNVIGVRKGLGNGPLLVIDAHLDTVFPIETDVTVKRIDGIYRAPGITDATRGLAVILAYVRALDRAGVQTIGDILFVGSVGEEGLGNLRGVKTLFENVKNISGFITLEPLPVGAVGILNAASIRHKVTYSGPGGHSHAAFGKAPSAVHAAGRAIAAIADLQAPTTPRTTFTVGLVSGGRSINTIAPDAQMQIDIRSDAMPTLRAMEKAILDAVEQSAVAENRRWGADTLMVSTTVVGERPGGMTPPDTELVQAVRGVYQSMHINELILAGVSTNAAVPISLGVPAIAIGPGGRFGGFHEITEWYDNTNAYKGAQATLLIALAMVGVNEVATPLLQPVAAPK